MFRGLLRLGRVRLGRAWEEAVHTIELLIGTFWLRPYVFCFLVAFLLIACSEIGVRRTAAWTVIGFAVAFASEFSSTRNGFPFGLYHYLDAATRHRELWISNVPFMDSLSFVFLSFVSWATARRILGTTPGEERSGAILWRPRVMLLGAALMVGIDLICDPVALRGDRWFLGKLYYYEHPGAFYGIPVSNYLGWAFVALAVQAVMAALERLGWLAGRPLAKLPRPAFWAPAFYAAIVLFNVAIAFWLELPLLGLLGLGIVAMVAAGVASGRFAPVTEPGFEHAR
jgi:putative membrane protein